MKRPLIIRIFLDEAEVDLFRGNMAFVLPMSKAEGDQFGQDVITTYYALARLSTELEAVIGATEAHGAPSDTATIATLTVLRNQLEELCVQMDRVRRLILRGKFVGEGDGFPQTKGPVQ